MTRAELLAYIDSNVYPNANNEITALMVRDVLHRMVGFMGDAATYGVGDVAPSDPGLVTGGAVQFAINTALSSAIKFQGVTTTPLTDGSTDPDIVINGDPYTARRGDEVLYGGREFLWTGSVWQQLGDEQSWALKTITISAGAGLVGGGSLAANRTISLSQATIDSLALANTALQSHQTIYGLTIKNSAGAPQLTYTPNTGAGSITLTKAMVGLGNVDNTAAADYFTVLENSSNQISLTIGGTNKKLTVAYATKASQDSAGNQISTYYLPKATFDDMFEKVALSGGGYAIKAKYGLYTDQFLSAGGLSSGGGTGGIDLDAMWASLTTNTDSHGTNKIHTAHLPTLSVGTGLTASYTQTSATDTTLNLGIASGYKLPTTTEWSNKADASALNDYLPLAGGTMSNTNVVTNLNADLLDGRHGSYYNNLLAFDDSGATSANSITYPLALLKRGTPSSEWWYVTSMYYSSVGSGYVSQIATNFTGNEPKMFIRKHHDSWTSWREVYHSGNFSVTLNGSSTTSASFYAPTTNGTTGQVLLATTNGAPAFSSSTLGSATQPIYLSGGVLTAGTALGTMAYASTGDYVAKAGDTMTGSLIFRQTSSTRRNGIIGTYDANRAAAIWSMGWSYQIAADGLTMGNLYGACYAYYGSGYTYGAGKSGGHSFVWAQEGSPTVALGNNVWTSGGFIKDGGTASQFLKADGSVDSNTYLTTTSAASTYLPLSGGTMTGDLNVPHLNITNTAGADEITFARGSYNYLRAKTSGGIIAFITGGKTMTGTSVDMAIGSGWVSINNRANGAGPYNLYVNGSAYASSLTLANNEAIKMLNSGGKAKNEIYLSSSNNLVIGEGQVSTADTYIYGNAIHLRYGAGSYGIYLNSSGNVGIGTTSPSYKLDVAGGARCNYVYFRNSAGTGNSGFIGRAALSADYMYIWNEANADMYFATNNTTRMQIKADGAITMGTGTVTPGALLTVAGVIASSGDITSGGSIALNGTSGGGTYGISLYGGVAYFKSYGIWMGLTSVGGTHGSVTGNWAAYFTMAGNVNRGWIFRKDDSTNVASLSAGGNFVANGAVTAGAASDARLKTNINTMSDAQAKALIMALRPVTFTWNQKATELYDQYKGNDLGFVAQEVEGVQNMIPGLSKAIGTIFNDYMRLDPVKFIAPIVKVEQGHERRIRELEKAVNARDEKIEELEKRLNMN